MAEHPTTTVDVGIRRLRRARVARRAFLSVLALFVALGALGVYGVRTTTARAQAHGWELTVRHPQIDRGGLPVTFEIAVRRDGAIHEPVVLRVASEYLDHFDSNGVVEPQPASATATDEFAQWEFAPPPGDVLVVRFDVRVQPGARGRTPGWVEVVSGERSGPRVAFSTWSMP